MTETRQTAGGIGLGVAVIGFTLLTVAVIAGVVGMLLWSRSDRLIDASLDQAVRQRTSAAGQVMARTLYGDMNDLRALAAQAGRADPATLRGMIEGMQGSGARISWLGFATTDGIVRAGSDGLLEGVDVSGRSWFRNALGSANGYAGDVHDAVLLAHKLPAPESGGPLRFIDMSVPVRNAAGDVTGVLGMHVNADWVAATLDETGRMLGLQLFLIDRSGKIIMAPKGMPATDYEGNVLAVARSGTQASLRQTWPDGKVYFASLVPSVSYADLPSFGWRLAGRIPASTFRPALSGLGDIAGYAFVMALVLVMALSVLFVRIFVRPLSRLAHSAERIAGGADDYPPEFISTSEARTFSRALGRIQTRRL